MSKGRRRSSVSAEDLSRLSIDLYNAQCSLGLSTRELSKRVGVSSSTLSSVMNKNIKYISDDLYIRMSAFSEEYHVDTEIKKQEESSLDYYTYEDVLAGKEFVSPFKSEKKVELGVVEMKECVVDDEQLVLALSQRRDQLLAEVKSMESAIVEKKKTIKDLEGSINFLKKCQTHDDSILDF